MKNTLNWPFAENLNIGSCKSEHLVSNFFAMTPYIAGMATIRDEHVILKYPGDEGETLYRLQQSLLIGIEKIALANDAAEKENQLAVFVLAELLREVMLTSSQLNVALGKKPYR